MHNHYCNETLRPETTSTTDATTSLLLSAAAGAATTTTATTTTTTITTCTVNILEGRHFCGAVKNYGPTRQVVYVLPACTRNTGNNVCFF